MLDHSNEALPFIQKDHIPGTIRFEVAEHLDPADFKTESARIDSYFGGDPDAHTWNREVIPRIREYNPKLLTIDSLGRTPYYTITISQNGTDKLTAYETKAPTADQVWFFLPGQPNQLTESGTIHVLAGDSLDIGIALRPESVNSPEIDLLNTLRAKIKGDFAGASLDVYLETYILSGMIGIADLIVLGKKVKDTLRLNPKMNRRDFVKKGARVAGGIVFGGALAALPPFLRDKIPQQAAFAGTNAEKEFYLGLADIVKPRFHTSDYLEARSDLLVMKTMDGAEEMGILPDEAIALMGYTHNFDLTNIIRSKAKRESALTAYTATMFAIVKEYYKHGPAPNVPLDQAINLMKDFLAVSDVFEVKQPDKSTLHTKQFSEEVAKVVKPFKTFQSQSVMSALANLR